MHGHTGGGTARGRRAEVGTMAQVGTADTHETESARARGGARLPELLAPAGTLDAFKAALAAGADAIYCGLSSFNARRNAENMTLEQFAHACEMAHLAGSRVYVTTNILMRDDELPQALALVHDAACAGADAFIVQDWGFLRLAHELWPELEYHLSTQANVHDARGVALAREAGCTRVTLSRELSLEEIEACSHEGVELEVFAHGALCVCYSGECLLSSVQRGRSANRGLCRQPCRLPYEMSGPGGRDVACVGGTRLLSPRDACTIADLPALVAAGVGALKIEGRMKALDYVATVVGAYRRALDELGAGGDPAADHAVDRALRRAFNRDFTDAYLHGRSDNDMMSFERGNNRGQLAGSLERMRGRVATLAMDEPLGAGDLLEIRNPAQFDDYVTVPAPADSDADAHVDVRLPRPMPEGCPVRVIRSEAGMALARAYAAREWPRKRPVDVGVRALVRHPFSVSLTTRAGDAHPLLGQDDVSARAEGFTMEPARTRAVTEADVREHVGRMGTSPFAPAGWDVRMDEGVGMAFSAVHSVRAQAVDALRAELLEPWRARAERLVDAPCSLPRRPDAPSGEAPELCALVTSPGAAHRALSAGATRVYAPVEDIVCGAGSSGRADLAPQGGSWPEGIIPLLGEVGRPEDRELWERVLRPGAPVAAGCVAALAAGAERGCACELWDTVPLHNRPSFEAAADMGARGAWLSPELTLLEIEQLAPAARMPVGIVVSGHVRTMTTEHCLLQSQGTCAERCAACPRRRGRVAVRDEFGRSALVTSDVHGRSRLWTSEPLDVTPQVPELLACGVTRFLVDGRLMAPEAISEATTRARRAVEAALAGETPAPRAKGATSGHLFERIG